MKHQPAADPQIVHLSPERIRYSQLDDQERQRLLDARAKRCAVLYLVIKRETYGGRRECEASLDELARLAGQGVDATRRQLVQLVEAGMILREIGTGQRRSVITLAAAGVAKPRPLGSRKSHVRDRDFATPGVAVSRPPYKEVDQVSGVSSSSADAQQRDVSIPRADDDDLREIDPDVAQRLAALRVLLPPSQAGQLPMFSRDQLLQALEVVQERKPDRNPGLYFWRALNEGFLPKRLIGPARPSPASPAIVHDDQAARDRLARLWKLDVGQGPAALAGQLAKEIVRASCTIEQRIASWIENGFSEAMGRQQEEKFDGYAPAALAATLEDPAFLALSKEFSMPVELS